MQLVNTYIQMGHNQTTLVCVIISNILPVVAIAFFGWNTSELMFVYWTEITLIIVLYSSLILFAACDPQLKKREYTSRAVPVPFLSTRSGWTQPVDWAPPINFWNIQFVSWTLLLGIAFWLVSGTIFIDLLNPTPTIQGGRFDTPVEDHIAVVTTAASRRAFVMAMVVFGIQCAAISREYFGYEQYQSFSAPELAEVPSRIGLYWFIGVLFTGLTLIVTWPFAGDVDPVLYTETRVVLLFLGLKLTMDWSLIRIQRQNSPLSPVRWFTFGWNGPKR